ncbi:AraC-like DNA-binding protein [Paraburkholderia sp. BL8N3]|nr:AraC family transcriptional regulator [Paraburkholderia sp. BL8N3]TCK32821.1 AraC-like DNA-binding protein [Paraburkholderia sp. BL8N3]
MNRRQWAMNNTSFREPARALSCEPIRAACTDDTIKTARHISVVVPSGTTTVRASDLDDQNHAYCRVTVRAPLIAVVPARAHLDAAVGDELQGVVVALDADTLVKTSRQAFGTEGRRVPLWWKAWDPFLREVAESIAALDRLEIPYPDYLDAYADVIALHLVYRYGARSPVQDCGASMTTQKLMLVESFIQENLAENITVGRLAALVHMSTSHFAHAFKIATGHSPHFHLTSVRLRVAKSMLSDGEMPLIEVAMRAGFQTQQHFTAVFHRYTGVTPRAFRLAHAA